VTPSGGRPYVDAIRPVPEVVDGLGVYRLIEPSFTNDQTLKTVLEFMSAALRID
jgi:hypothetical protein